MRIRCKRSGKRFQVFGPTSEDPVWSEIPGGRWRTRSDCWSFPWGSLVTIQEHIGAAWEELVKQNPWMRGFHSDGRSLAHGEVTITRRGSRILVAAPYREEFRAGARQIMDAKWRGAVKVWSFPHTELLLVRDLIDKVFGRERVPEWMWNARSYE